MNAPHPGAANECLSPMMASGECLLVDILNAPALHTAYGDTVAAVVAEAVFRRLQECGFPRAAISFDDRRAQVDLAALPHLCALPPRARDQIGESILAVLCREALVLDRQRFYLHAQVAFAPGQGAACFARHDGDRRPAPATASAIGHVEDGMAYRRDMALAHDFLEDLRHGVLLLAFQPVSVFANTDHHLYHEALLRRAPSVRAPYSCIDALAALKRLGLISRLDRSVVWATVELLERHPHMQLGCNVSALSLREETWWRLLRARLALDPDLCGRLTLEITEPGAAGDAEEAIALLDSLRRLGCRIAIDDIGTEHDHLEFMRRAQPDVVKIDRTVLLQSGMRAQTPSLLRKLARLCADYCPLVVVEGVETLDELSLAIGTGAQGVQGFLIAEPSLQPAWLDDLPARLEDTFWLGLAPCFRAAPPRWIGAASHAPDFHGEERN